jgi:hypothetical protein
LSFYNSPEAWAGRAIAAIVAIVAVVIFVGPYFLVRAHNLAKADETERAAAAAAAQAAKEPTIVTVPIFSPPAK